MADQSTTVLPHYFVILMPSHCAVKLFNAKLAVDYPILKLSNRDSLSTIFLNESLKTEYLS